MKSGLLIHTLLLGAAMHGFYFDPPFVIPAGVMNKPFQARYEHISSQKLSGAQVSQQTRAGAVYRAADGRSRRESFREDEPEGTAGEILIHDPIVQKCYLLDIEGKAVISVSLDDASEDVSNSLGGAFIRPPAKIGTDLGQKSIEGFTCQGYRKSQPGGGIIEYWVSEELGEVLMAKSVSAEEESLLRLFDIRRTEPDPELFVVPAEYKETINISGGEADTLLSGTTFTDSTANSESEVFIDAALNGDIASLKAMLDAGTDVNIRDQSGNTALIYAASGRQIEVVKILLAAGADVNVRGNDGSTPLTYAALSGQAEMVSALLKAGADVQAENNAGFTAFKIAQNKRHTGVIQLLTRAGAKDRG